MLRAYVVIACALAMGPLTAREAEACACCDAFENRTPVGWTEKGGAVLVDAATNVGCEPKRWLEVWVIGAAAPSACYDLYGEPDKRIACDAVQSYEYGKKPRTSKQPSRFPYKGSSLAATDVRVLQRRADAEKSDGIRVGVELNAGGVWKRVWSGAFGDGSSDVRASATVWPNQQGKRAMLIVSYSEYGTGNTRTAVYWITLPTIAAP